MGSNQNQLKGTSQMANSVLTIVFQKAEQKLDTVVAAAVNELHNLGHIVTEVRVMGDSGEAKVALNQVAGIIDTATDTAVADAKADVAAVEPSDTVENKSASGASPVSPIAGVPVDDAPEQTVEEKRLALLDELDALDKEEAAAKVDPTQSTTAS